jgi:hypothetical protein
MDDRSPTFICVLCSIVGDFGYEHSILRPNIKLKLKMELGIRTIIGV